MFSVYSSSRLTKQAVYNANKLSELVQKRMKLQNWLDYYQNKHSRNPSKRPLIKVRQMYATTLLS